MRKKESNIKKKSSLITISVIVLALFLVCYYIFYFNNKFVSTDEELLALIRREKNIPQAYSLHIIGDYNSALSDDCLLCVAAMNGCAGTNFYAIELERRGNRFGIFHELHLLNRGPDEYATPWKNGYLFFSGNPQNTGISISFGAGDQDDLLIPVPQVPFVYFLDLSEHHDSFSMTYLFLPE